MLNATGVLLHTNLGRAPLSAAARGALDVAAGTCDVELDLATGGRGPRGRRRVDALLAAVPAAGAAHLVNNGAAALALVATALAARRRGRSSSPAASWSRSATASASPTCSPPPAPGCARSAPPTASRPADYADAIGPDTAFVLKVHPSNFVVTGLHPLRRRRTSWPGSACRWSPTSAPGCSPRTRCCPTSRTRPRRWRSGATLVTASGDKLLGGPQAGLLLGAPRRGRRAGRPHPPAPAGPGDAGRQADPGRVRGHAARPGHADPRPRLDADPAALRARAHAAGRARCAARGIDADGRRLDGHRRRRRRARRRRCPAPRSRCPSGSPRRCAPASPRCSAASSAAAACSTCARVPPDADDALAAAVLRRARGPRACTSSPPPATSTTASRRWSGR